MKCKQIILCLLLFTMVIPLQSVFAQNTETILKGKVTGKDGLALPGVTVMVKGKPAEITQTDVEGNFTIRTKEFSGILVFSSVGYSINETAFNPATITFQVKMEESVSILNDVVLTGYIKQKKSDITAAISSVRNKEFKDQPVANLACRNNLDSSCIGWLLSEILIKGGCLHTQSSLISDGI